MPAEEAGTEDAAEDEREHMAGEQPVPQIHQIDRLFHGCLLFARMSKELIGPDPSPTGYKLVAHNEPIGPTT